MAAISSMFQKLTLYLINEKFKVLKARYFPSGNLMSASCGNKPSATWHSLMVGKIFFSRGLRRSIGNGRTKGVWTDQWVPSDAPIILTRPNHIETGEEMVCDLLKFDKSTCLRIKSIPPNTDQGEDRWVWEHDSSGVYSV
ncbi:uncharacterized protein G2W53_029392 [Senna tora]|uniref:Uncharacterized protein n=1 Tax=Senna tora TaxID=362788 RepID=A0A834T2Z0_9FABA|nr:uncharacterized protein G2W53_029392 [Senna tora]